MKAVPFYRPAIDSADVRAVVRALKSGWITTGPKTREFEQVFAEYTAAPAALALSSCTAGLHLAILSLGVGPGDYVLTTPMTFCSGVHVIEHAGAVPLLADIDPFTLNIDPEKIEEVILENKKRRRKIKAMIVTHFAGHPCDMDRIGALSRKYRIPVVEDAAHAVPAKFRGRMVGGLGNLTAFSFYATKNLATGEGGMLTGPPSLLKKARRLSLHGMSRDAWKRYAAGGSWHYDVVEAGFKYNMTDIQAALGLSQLAKLKKMQERRRQIVKAYDEAFIKIPELFLPVEKKSVEHAWHLYVLRLNPGLLKISRNEFIKELNAKGIGTSVHFIPMHRHRYYKKKYGWKPADFPNAEREYQRSISLPLYPGMTDSDVRRVIDAVRCAAVRFRKKAGA